MSDATTRVMLNTRLDPGVQLNDTYEIDERIASGGMGEVYRGHNIQTGEPVAIKTILPELADKEAISSLFKREATTLGRLHHETIVRYYTFSRDPRLGRTYLAMEFVEGISLADRIRDVPLTADEVRRLFAKVADGLALAHSAKVIHRDLSPDNIILRGGDVGRPTLIDFGIARNANVGEGTLIGGGFAGKFNFVSPEQLGMRNREVDGRSDIYSLGLVIAAALRGSPIEMGGSHVELIEKRTTVPDITDIDDGLRPLVEAMLQPNPDDRPADATVVAEWLRATASDARTAAPVNDGALASPVRAAGVPFTVQPVTERLVDRRTGAPFGAPMSSPSSATQLITPTAGARPANGVSESPFGPARSDAEPIRATPAASQPIAGNLPEPAAAFAWQPVRKSNAGRYTLIGGALLLLAAGGGAYTTGLIGPDRTSDTEQTDKGADTSRNDAKSAEHDAIGDAIEDALANGTASTTSNGTGGTTTNDTTATGTGASSEGTSGAGDSTTATSGSGTEGAQTVGTGGDISGTSGIDNLGTGGDTQTATNSGKDGSGSGSSGNETGGAVAGPDTKTQETADGITRMVDVGVAWLRHYDGGPCFFISVTSVTDKTLTAKGFGLDTPAFRKLYDSFLSANDFDPVINGHAVRQTQCAAVDFLKAVQPGATDNPQLQIASDQLKAGDTLNVSVDKTDGKKLDLLLIDADGFVHNMKSFAKEAKADGKSSFDIKLGGTKIDPDSPQMVIALTSPSGLGVPQGTDQARAADLFPRLGREIEVMKSSVGVDFGYFQLSP